MATARGELQARYAIWLMAFLGFDASLLDLGLLLALLLWTILYMVYRIVWHPDFGLPIRRRVLCTHLRVEREQIAFVPFWWNNIQVQRAVNRHFKLMLEQTFTNPVRTARF